MRLSELLHRDVLDADGQPMGSVDDVRVVQDGPILGGFGAALRLDGLVVGRGGWGVRLGFHRSKVKGPAPLRAFFSMIERRAAFVPLDAVDDIDANPLRLRVRADELGPPPT